MTKLELIKQNRASYAELEKRMPGMTGIEKAVAEHMTLKWIKGRDWVGGMSDAVATKAFEKLAAMGYGFEEVDAEFDRQMRSYL